MEIEDHSPFVDFFRQVGKGFLNMGPQTLIGLPGLARNVTDITTGQFLLPDELKAGREQADEMVRQLGREGLQGIEDLIPGGPEGFAGEVGAGVGSGLAFLAGGLLGGTSAAGFLGAAAGEAELSEEARAFGADEETIRKASVLGSLIGATEALPIGGLFKKLDRFSGGSIRKVLIEAVKQGGEEAAQEVFQQLSNNAAAMGLFDENRELFDNVVKSGGVGLITGMLFGGVGTAGVNAILPASRVREIMKESGELNTLGAFGNLSEEEFRRIEEQLKPGASEEDILGGLIEDVEQTKSVTTGPSIEELERQVEELRARNEAIFGKPTSEVFGQKDQPTVSVTTPPSPTAKQARETVVEATFNPEEDDLNGLNLNHAHQRALEERLGLSSQRMGKFDFRSVKQAVQRAQIMVAQDPAGRTAAQMAVARANDVNRHLTGVVTSQRDLLLTDVEHGLMLLGGAELLAQRGALSLQLDVASQSDNAEAASSIRNQVGQIDAQIEEIITATDLAGSEVGRALNMRKAYLNLIDLTPQGVLREGRLAKGVQLNQEETDRLLKEQREAMEARARLEEAMNTHDERLLEREKAAVDQRVREELKREVTIEQLEQEIEQLKSDLRKLGLTGLQSTFAPGSRFAAEGFWKLGKLIRAMIVKQKLTSIDQVVSAVHATKGLEVLRPLEIYQAINAQKPKTEAEAKKAQLTRMQKIKKQSKQLETVEKIARGIAERHGIKLQEPKAGVRPVVTKGRVRAQSTETGQFVSNSELRGFNSATAQLKQMLLEDPTFTTEEVQNMIHGLSTVQQQIKDGKFDEAEESFRVLRQIASFDKRNAEAQRRIRERDYEAPEKKVEPQTPFDRELLRAKLRYRRSRHRLQNEIDRLRPFFEEGDTTTKKGFKVAREITRLSRQLLTIDVASAFLRQGVIGLGMPGKFFENAVAAIQTVVPFSEQARLKAETLALRLDEHPLRFAAEEMGVEFTEIGGGVRSGEELFGSHLMRQVPEWAEQWAKFQNDSSLANSLKLGASGIKELSEGAERVYTTFLNLTRMAFVENFLKSYPDATIEQRRSYGRMINAMTGRGNMKASTAAAASTVLFAPKFAYSRFETIGRTLGATKDVMKSAVTSQEINPASAQIIQDMAKFTGLALGTLGLFAFAAAAGIFGDDDEEVNVNIDPESSDFGKIIVGNTRYDIFGGFQQPVSLALRFMTGALDKVGLRENIKDQDPYDLALRYALYKTSPAITLPAAVLFGETVVGEEVSPPKALLQSFMPLFTQDFADALEKEGIGAALVAGTASSFGVGSSTFGDEMKSGDMVKLMSRARMAAPPAPRYRESVREDAELKESLDAAYEGMLADRLRMRKNVLEDLEGERLQRYIRLQGEIVRRSFRRFTEAASVSGRKPSEEEVDRFLERVGQE